MTYPSAVAICYKTIIQSNVFKLNGPSIDLPRALCLLGKALSKYDLPEGIWEELGEFEEACLGDLVVGAYWACTDWHAGQFSDTYAALCSLGNVYSPNMESHPSQDESAFTAYELISEWFEAISGYSHS